MSGIVEEVTIGDARLILGDCREVLPGLGRFDLLLTDPPYGIGLRMKGGGWAVSGGYCEISEWDEFAPQELVSMAIEKASASIIWGGNYFTLPPSRGWLSWSKLGSAPKMADMELAWTSIDMVAREFRHHVEKGFLRVGTDRHPTQKPVALMEWCLQQAGSPKSVLDPFAGSFSTGVACINLGIPFTGIEREPRYFEPGIKRIEAAHRQPRLFQDPPAPPEQVDVFGGAA